MELQTHSYEDRSASILRLSSIPTRLRHIPHQVPPQKSPPGSQSPPTPQSRRRGSHKAPLSQSSSRSSSTKSSPGSSPRASPHRTSSPLLLKTPAGPSMGGSSPLAFSRLRIEAVDEEAEHEAQVQDHRENAAEPPSPSLSRRPGRFVPNLLVSQTAARSAPAGGPDADAAPEGSGAGVPGGP